MRLLPLLAILAIAFVRPTAAEIHLANILEAGGAAAVEVQGDLIYGGLGRHLLVIDASDPAQPTRIASEELPSAYIYDIVIDGNFAYVGTDDDLSIVDISNPLDPVLLGREASYAAMGVAVNGPIAYVTQLTSGIRTIDVSNPLQPVLIGSGAVDGWPIGIRVIGSFAYAAGYDGGLAIVDISNPLSPVQLSYVRFWPSGWDLDVVGNLAYLPGYDGLAIVDVSVPTAPIEIGRYDSNFLQYGRCVSVVGDYAYLLDQYYMFEVVDISDPTNPVRVLQEIEIGGIDVVNVGDRLYTADSEASFRIRNISVPTAPSVEGVFGALLAPESVSLQDGVLHVGESGRLATIDASDPYAPNFLGSASLYTPITALAPRGSTLFAGRSASIFDGTDGGMSIFDISDSSAPLEVSSRWGFTSVWDIAADSEYAYLLGRRLGSGFTFVTYDVSNPASPIEVSSGQFPFLSRFDMGDNLVLVAGGANDLKIYDIANHLQSPVLRSTFTPTQDAQDVAVFGHLGFVADGTIGLIVVDFSNPDNPIEIGRLSGIGQPVNILQKYPYVVTVGGDPLLRIIDVSSPSSPSLVDTYNTGGSYRLAVEGSTIATIAGYHGSVLLLDAPILNLTTPVEKQHPGHATLTAFPNPFNPEVTIAFTIASASEVVLDIFDAAGRTVWSHSKGHTTVGAYRVIWNGRDSNGNPSASGVYFCRLRAGNETVNYKLVLLK